MTNLRLLGQYDQRLLASVGVFIAIIFARARYP